MLKNKTMLTIFVLVDLQVLRWQSPFSGCHRLPTVGCIIPRSARRCNFITSFPWSLPLKKNTRNWLSFTSKCKFHLPDLWFIITLLDDLLTRKEDQAGLSMVVVCKWQCPTRAFPCRPGGVPAGGSLTGPEGSQAKDLSRNKRGTCGWSPSWPPNESNTLRNSNTWGYVIQN